MKGVVVYCDSVAGMWGWKRGGWVWFGLDGCIGGFGFSAPAFCSLPILV